jgi:hypothetical protein
MPAALDGRVLDAEEFADSRLHCRTSLVRASAVCQASARCLERLLPVNG